MENQYTATLKEDSDVDDYSFECGSGSIWLSLSFTFLLFGLLF